MPKIEDGLFHLRNSASWGLRLITNKTWSVMYNLFPKCTSEWFLMKCTIFHHMTVAGLWVIFVLQEEQTLKWK